MKIRPLSQTDFDDLDHFFGVATRFRNPVSKWQKYFSEQEKGLRYAQVIEISGKVVGIGSLKIQSEYPYFNRNNIPEIHDLLVADQEQGKGRGKVLIVSLEEQARKLGYPAVGLGVGLYEDYGRAHRLYVKLGYVPDGKGATYNYEKVVPGESYPLDDDLLIWFTKAL